MKKCILFLFWIANSIIAQNTADFQIHSHNDYLQNVPFWKAFSAGATSIEVDVFLIEDSLFVAHTLREIDTRRTFEKLYLEPVQKTMELGLERPANLQLLIDIKSEAYSTLNALIKTLRDYPEIIESDVFSIVISGNRPKASEYINYPDFIQFDYQSLEEITNPSILQKIELVSLNFRDFSDWNGKGGLTPEDLEKVTATIKKAHSFGKPFRFWATPDSKTAWETFVYLGVDFINTDNPLACSNYLQTLREQ